MLQLLWKQLLHDLKASWKKTAVLGMLLLVGLYFWLPMLMDAFATDSRENSVASRVVLPQPSPSAAALSASSESAGEASETPTFDWQTASRAFGKDALLQPADGEEIRADAFRVDPRQFPPPVVFAEAEAARPVVRKAVRESEPAAAAQELPSGLVLNSTIVSETRRAALINRRVYQEGSQLTYEGHTYRLTAVEPRRVELRDGAGVFELKIPSPYSGDESGY